MSGRRGARGPNNNVSRTGFLRDGATDVNLESDIASSSARAVDNDHGSTEAVLFPLSVVVDADVDVDVDAVAAARPKMNSCVADAGADAVVTGFDCK